MLVVVTGSGNLSLFERVTRASLCRCGVRYLSPGMSTRPCTVLKNMISWFLVLLDSRVSHSRWSNIEVTLLVLWYLFVTYLAALR